MAHRKRIAVVTKHLAGGQAASSLFNGSVTIITGAGRGIGREAAFLDARVAISLGDWDAGPF